MINNKTTHAVLLNETPITYHWVESLKAKTVRINISREQGLRVTVPVRGSRRSPINIPELLFKKSNWILKHLERIKKEEKPRLTNGGTLLYQGEPHKIFIKSDSQGTFPLFPTVVKSNQSIIIYAREASDASDLLREWFRERAKKEIPRRLEEMNLQIGLPYKKIIIRNQKSRWGSCAPNGTLSFNFRLMMAKPAVLDYVIIHELIHLQVPNHSLRFWKQVATYDPDYVSHRHWLIVQAPLLDWNP